MKMFRSSLFSGKTTAAILATIALLVTGKLGAQTDAVSNLGQALDVNGSFFPVGRSSDVRDLVFNFTTGTTAADFTGVSLTFNIAVGSPGALTLGLYSTFTNGGIPANGASNLLTTLTVFGTNQPTTGGLVTFSVSGLPLTLAAGTTYYLKLSADSVPATGNNYFAVPGTALTGQTGLTGWSIGDSSSYGNGSFYNANSLMPSFSVQATEVSAVPEPSTYAAIAGVAMLGFAVWHRRRRKNSTTFGRKLVGMRYSAISRGILTIAMVLTICVGTTNSARSQVLIGSGDHLALPVITTLTGAVGPSYVNSNPNFTATWDSSAATAWQGTVNAIGPLPIGSTNTTLGTSTYNFTTLTAGFLPTNSYFVLGDLDSGTGAAEHITLTAYTTSNTLITSPWLNIPTLIYNSTTDGGGSPIATDMPGWNWNMTTASSYYFDGGTVPLNPTIALAMFSNLDIGYLVVYRDNTTSNFAVFAPSAIPEPSTYAAFAGAAMLGFADWRRRRAVSAKTVAA